MRGNIEALYCSISSCVGVRSDTTHLFVSPVCDNSSADCLERLGVSQWTFVSNNNQFDCSAQYVQSARIRDILCEKRPTALSTVLFIKLKGRGTASPGCTSILEKSMLSLSIRAGVPVCNRPSWNPAFRRDPERPTEGASPMRPAGKRFKPVDKRSTFDVCLWQSNVTHQCGSLRQEMCLYISQLGNT